MKIHVKHTRLQWKKMYLQTYVIIQSKYSEVLICKKGLIQAFIN